MISFLFLFIEIRYSRKKELKKTLQLVKSDMFLYILSVPINVFLIFFMLFFVISGLRETRESEKTIN